MVRNMTSATCLSAAALVLLAAAPAAHAQRLRSAYDPRVHIRPPTMRGVDGAAAELVYDADFAEAAARWRSQHPAVRFAAAAPGVTQSGEVLVLQGDDETVTFDGRGYGLTNDALVVAGRKVIESAGDNFQAITVWLTFEDRNSAAAEAYEMPVKNEVEGLGRLPVRDGSTAFGSRGVLRSMLNMKTVGLRAGETRDSWATALTTWGQESAHRWMVFMNFIDQRTGRSSDAMLGRDCAHYSRYLDTQASVHDGLAWTDNGDGTFTWTESNQRYGDLDLYGMGLMAADEVRPFFLIDNIPNYRYPATCNQYALGVRIPDRKVSGQRVDITIDDVIAANGARKVPTDERQDYWREAQVILIAPNETATSPRVAALATRINKARLYWEDWNRTASRNRLVMCTQISADCGDPRSDVTAVAFNSAGKGPAAGPLALDVSVTNTGTRATAGVKAAIEVTIPGGEVRQDTKDVGSLEVGAVRTVSFPVDLRTVPCGTEVVVKASAQSDFHHHRSKSSFLVGTTDRFSDGFEKDSGWTINPDGDDSASGAQWERGRPEATVTATELVQPATTHTGAGAWVTGLAAEAAGTRSNLVRDGKATLQSPLYDTDGLHEPLLRYWVSFAGVRAARSSQGLEPSADSRLVVQARAVDQPAMGAPVPGPWLDVDTLAEAITPTWAQRSAAVPADALTRNRFQLRFVAIDGNPEMGGVEAAIDDIVVASKLPACYLPISAPSSGGGCAVAGGRGPGAVILVVLPGALVVLARRRRRRP
jgi:hypothetical protein